MNPIRSIAQLGAAVLMLSILTGCGEKEAAAQAPANGMPPPEVSVVTVAPENITLTTELPGRIDPVRIAQVRARVPGIVQKRVYREGSDVKAGDVLFRIDPGPYRAAYSSAQATLAKAEANQAQANLKAQRYKPLVETNAISRQEYDDVVTSQKQTAADVATARAALETARLNLGYATVTAPISGRAGRAQVTEGALVGQGEPTPLAVVQQIDTVYVNLTQSSNELLALQRAMSSGRLKNVGNGQAKVTLVTQDGQAYPHAGKLLFSDLSVDETSGAVTLRAEFPNPNRFLLPGMYVRARLEQGVRDNAITVPQQAVQRNPTGAVVMVVGADGKVAAQPVKADTAHGNKWIVSEGLKAGDRVIVEGLQKVKPGAPVTAVPWKSAAAGNNAQAPSSGAGAPAQPQSGAK